MATAPITSSSTPTMIADVAQNTPDNAPASEVTTGKEHSATNREAAALGKQPSAVMAESVPPEPTESDWHAQRRLGIGGSDLKHLFAAELEKGREKDAGCELRLWLEKTGAIPDYPEIERDVMRRGKMLEALVAELYEEKTGRKLRRSPARVNRDYPWARVNMDRQILTGHGSPGWEVSETGALEIKTHNHWLFAEVLKSGLKLSHLLQLQHALFVTGYPWGSFAVLHPDSWRLEIPPDKPRNEQTISLIKARGDAFWKLVETNCPPPPLKKLTDARCKECPYRKSCRGAALAEATLANDKDDDTPVSLEAHAQAPELAPKLAQLVQVSTEISNLEAIKEQLTDDLRAEITARGLTHLLAAGVEGSFRATCTVGKWSGLDQKALAAKWPDIYKEVFYSKPHSKPTLRVYPV